MYPYKILADGAIDLLTEDLNHPSVKILPMTISMGNDSYPIKGRQTEAFLQSFYKEVSKGSMPTTSMIPSYTYEEAFTQEMQEGFDVLNISMSSGITGTFIQSQIACKNIQNNYPKHKVVCMDSLSCSYTAGLLVHKALENLDLGLSIEENQKDLEEYKLSTLAFGLAMSLTHLRRGGRLSASSAMLGTALSIKPIVYFNKEGALLPLSKARGLKQSFKVIVSLQEKYGKKSNTYGLISHCDNFQDAEKLKNNLLQETSLEEIDILPMSPIIGSHLGPKSLIFTTLGERP